MLVAYSAAKIRNMPNCHADYPCGSITRLTELLTSWGTWLVCLNPKPCASDSIWLVPGTFDHNGESTL